MAKSPSAVLWVAIALFLFTPFFVFSQPSQTPAEWRTVESALGRSGKLQLDGAFKFAMPRRDLKVAVGDVQINPGFALGACCNHATPDGESGVPRRWVATNTSAEALLWACIGRRPKFENDHPVFKVARRFSRSQ